MNQVELAECNNRLWVEPTGRSPAAFVDDDSIADWLRRWAAGGRNKASFAA